MDTNTTSPPSMIEILDGAGDRPVVCAVRGEIDISNVGELRAGLADAIGRGPAVVVDLSGVTFLASVGVRALHVAAGSGRIVLVPGPHVHTVLRICGLDRVVDCLPDRAAAERACRAPAGGR